MSGMALRALSYSTTLLHNLSHRMERPLQQTIGRIALKQISFFSSSSTFVSRDPTTIGIKLVGQTVITMVRDVTASGGARGVPYFWDLYKGNGVAGGDGLDAPVSQFIVRWRHIAAVGGKHCAIWPLRVAPARKFLFGHDAPVNCVQLSDKVCVTGTDAATGYVWNTENGELVRTLEGHSKKITGLELEDETVVTASEDKTCRVWDLKKEEETHVLEHSQPITCMSLRGRVLVTGTKGGLCQVSNVFTGKVDSFLMGHMGEITAIQQVKGKPWVVTGSADGTARLWDLISKDCLKEFKGHTGKINCLHQDGPYLATGSADHTFKIWNLIHPGEPLMFDEKEGAEVTALQMRGTNLVIGLANAIWRHVTFDEAPKLQPTPPKRPKILEGGC